MSICIEEREGIFIVRFENQSQSDFSKNLRDEIRKILKKKKYKLVVDLSHIELISSSILSVLLATLENTQKQGGTLLLCNVSKTIQELLHITELSDYFQLFTSVEKAINSLK